MFLIETDKQFSNGIKTLVTTFLAIIVGIFRIILTTRWSLKQWDLEGFPPCRGPVCTRCQDLDGNTITYYLSSLSCK